jgi:hypothetical protein
VKLIVGRRRWLFMKNIVEYLKIVSLGLSLFFIIQGCHAGFHIGSTDQTGTRTAQSMTPEERDGHDGF